MWMFRGRKQQHRRTAGEWGWVVFRWYFFLKEEKENMH